MNNELLQLKDQFERCQKKYFELEAQCNSLTKDFEKKKNELKKRLAELNISNSKELESKIQNAKNEYENILDTISTKIEEVNELIRNSISN